MPKTIKQINENFETRKVEKIHAWIKVQNKFRWDDLIKWSLSIKNSDLDTSFAIKKI